MSSETVELSERVELSSDAAEVSLEVSAALDSSTAEETEAVLSAASPPSPATEAYTMPPVRQASTTTVPAAKDALALFRQAPLDGPAHSPDGVEDSIVHRGRHLGPVTVCLQSPVKLLLCKGNLPSQQAGEGGKQPLQANGFCHLGQAHRFLVGVEQFGQLRLGVAAQHRQHIEEPVQRRQIVHGQLPGLPLQGQPPLSHPQDEIPVLGDAEGLGVLFGEDGFAESRCFHQGGLGKVLLGGDAPGEHLLPQAAVDAGHRNAGGLVIPQQQAAQVGRIVFCHVKKGLHGLLAAPAGFIGQIHGRFPAFLGIS